MGGRGPILPVATGAHAREDQWIPVLCIGRYPTPEAGLPAGRFAAGRRTPDHLAGEFVEWPLSGQSWSGRPLLIERY